MGRSKTLSLLIGVLLAALAASAPPAGATVNFDAVEVEASLSGEQTAAHTFTFESEVKGSCSKATLSGKLEERSESITLAPSYAECTASGLAATVEPNGCQYVFKTWTEKEAGVFNGKTDITCPKEPGITITGFSGNCQVKIGSQTGLTAVTYRNKQESSPTKVLAEVAVTGVKYTVTKDGFGCPFKGTGEKTGGSMAGSSLLKATAAGTGTGFAVLQVPITRLCAEAPDAKSKCPAGAAIESTELKGQIKAPNDPPFEISIQQAGVQQRLILCDGQFSGKTTTELGAPLQVQSMSFTFTACSSGLVKCSVEMTNAPQTGSLFNLWQIDAKWNGSGVLGFPFLLRAECGEVLVKCTYESAKANGELVTRLEGGFPAKLVFMPKIQVLKNAKVFAGEETGCFSEADLNAEFEVTEPAAVWVTS